MTEVVADHGNVHAGLKERDRAAMAENMRGDSLPTKVWHFCCREPHVLREHVRGPIAREGSASSAPEDACRICATVVDPERLERVYRSARSLRVGGSAGTRSEPGAKHEPLERTGQRYDATRRLALRYPRRVALPTARTGPAFRSLLTLGSGNRISAPREAA